MLAFIAFQIVMICLRISKRALQTY